jgi:hypothetical protein
MDPLVAKYFPVFHEYLSDGEDLLTACQSIHVETSTRLGRGKGDGAIGITNRRVIHLFRENIGSNGLTIDRSKILKVERGWIAVPKHSNLKLTVSTNTGAMDMNFYIWTKFCKEIVQILSQR